MTYTFSDVERLVVDYLKAEFPNYSVTAPAGVGTLLPTDWTRNSARYVVVASDGVLTETHDIAQFAIVRCVAWSKSPTVAKDLAAATQAILTAHPGGAPIGGAWFLTGVQPAHDDQSNVHLAATTTRVAIRSSVLS